MQQRWIAFCFQNSMILTFATVTRAIIIIITTQISLIKYLTIVVSYNVRVTLVVGLESMVTFIFTFCSSSLPRSKKRSFVSISRQHIWTAWQSVGVGLTNKWKLIPIWCNMQIWEVIIWKCAIHFMALFGPTRPKSF